MRTIAHIAAEKLSEATPAEIDTVLSEVHEHRARLHIALSEAQRRLTRYGEHREREAHATRETIQQMESELVALNGAAASYDDEYRRRPWNRYFLVANVGGHVHRGMNCTTCFPTTRYVWIVDLADCDESEMIREYGERACTVCFPDAPANPAYGGPGRRDAAAAAQREQERIERNAVKAAKQLQPDLVFRDLDGWAVKTVAAAKTALRDIAETRAVAGSHRDTNGWYTRRAEQSVTIEQAARHALTQKGVSDDELDTIMERATKKARKDWGL